MVGSADKKTLHIL